MSETATAYDASRWLMESGAPLIDQTRFLSDFWETGASVCVVCRPAGFGKTTMLSAAARLLSREAPDPQVSCPELVCWESDGLREVAGRLPLVTLDLKSMDDCDDAEIAARLAALLDEAAGVREGMPDAEPDVLAASVRLKAHLAALADEAGEAALLLLDGFDVPHVRAWQSGAAPALMRVLDRALETLLEKDARVRVLMMGEVPLSVLAAHACVAELHETTFATSFGVTEQDSEALLEACGHEALTGALYRRFAGYRFGGASTVLPTRAVVGAARTGELPAQVISPQTLDEAARLLLDPASPIICEATPLMGGRYLDRELPCRVELCQVGVRAADTWAYLAARGVVSVSGERGAATGAPKTLEWATDEVREGLRARLFDALGCDESALSALAEALVGCAWGAVEVHLAGIAGAMCGRRAVSARAAWRTIALGIACVCGRAWTVRAGMCATAGVEVLTLEEATPPWREGRLVTLGIAPCAEAEDEAALERAAKHAQEALDAACVRAVSRSSATLPDLIRAGCALDGQGYVHICA